MGWTVLTDNRTQNPSLQTEHGLSILLETVKHRILLDTGASDAFIRNAEQLGIDLSTVDYVFISHGHSDHAGGLKHFLEINDKAKVIVSSDALKGKFFSKRRYLHSINTEWPKIPQERLLTIEHSESIDEDIFILAHIPQIHPMPEGNQYLFVEDTDGRYGDHGVGSSDHFAGRRAENHGNLTTADSSLYACHITSRSPATSMSVVAEATTIRRQTPTNCSGMVRYQRRCFATSRLSSPSISTTCLASRAITNAG